jgi:hypothetical protein
MKKAVEIALSVVLFPVMVAGLAWLLGGEAFKFGVEVGEEVCNWIYS